MKQPDTLKMVKEFQENFDSPVLDTPTIPPDRTDIRLSLIKEELQELEDAINKNDLVEVADALCDLQYVLSGTILEFGFGEKFEALFNEVHRSNMSKMCENIVEAEETHAKYEAEGVGVWFKPKGGDRYLVMRDGDNKVLKSSGYSPADLVDILNKPIEREANVQASDCGKVLLVKREEVRKLTRQQINKAKQIIVIEDHRGALTFMKVGAPLNF